MKLRAARPIIGTFVLCWALVSASPFPLGVGPPQPGLTVAAKGAPGAPPPGWSEVNTSGPPASAGAMMAYSARDHWFVMFGGWNGTALDMTWLFDPTTGAWEDVTTSPRPPARGDGMLAFDERSNLFVLFGGWSEAPPGVYHRLADTWVFSLGNRSWSLRSPAVSPPARSDSAVAYDPAKAVVFLFGGFDGSNYLNDEWSYSAANDTWTSLSSPTRPSPRADGRMVYEATSRQFFLFGGNDYSGPNFTFHHLDDTWAFDRDASTWSPVSTDASPSPRDYSILTALPEFGELLLVGGYGHNKPLGDVWAFNSTLRLWRNITVPGGPTPRFAAVGGYDPLSRELVMFGGLAVEGLQSETWLYRYPPPVLGAAYSSRVEAITGDSVFFLARVLGGTGIPATVRWNFGDGTTSEGMAAAHAFRSPGVFDVRFEYVDNLGGQVVLPVTVSVGLLAPLWVDFLLATVILSALVIILGLRWAIKRLRRSAPALRPNSDEGNDPRRTGGKPR